MPMRKTRPKSSGALTKLTTSHASTTRTSRSPSTRLAIAPRSRLALIGRTYVSLTRSASLTRLGKDPKALPQPSPNGLVQLLALDLAKHREHRDTAVSAQLVEADPLQRRDVAVLVEMERPHDAVLDLRLEQLCRHRGPRPVRPFDGGEHDLRA